LKRFGANSDSAQTLLRRPESLAAGSYCDWNHTDWQPSEPQKTTTCPAERQPLALAAGQWQGGQSALIL